MLQKMVAVFFVGDRVNRQQALHDSPVNESAPDLTQHLLNQTILPVFERDPPINQRQPSAAEIVGELLRQQFIRVSQRCGHTV